MAIKSIESFPNVLPDHPHRRLYILISILIFVLVAGGIVMYQIRNVEEDTGVIYNAQSNQTQSLAQQKDEAIIELKSRIEDNPPLSQSAKSKAILEMKNRIKNK